MMESIQPQFHNDISLDAIFYLKGIKNLKISQ